MSENPAILTQRQKEIVDLVVKGHNRESIGHQLGIAPSTVGRHMDILFKHLGVNSTLELVLRLYDLKEKVL